MCHQGTVSGARGGPQLQAPAHRPWEAGAEFGRPRASGRPRSSHGAPGGTEHAELFLTCAVTGVSAPWELEPAGALGAAGAALWPARWALAPEGGTRARPVRKPVPLLWGCLPEASPWALPSRPGLVGADGAARSLDLSACCPCRTPCWTDGSVSWAPGTARPGELPCPGHWPETAPSLSSVLEA